MGVDLIDLMESCFEDDPGDRPADAAELAERLGRLLAKHSKIETPRPFWD